jgi:uncharacterized membrane protein YidH (DUF202 family)
MVKTRQQAAWPCAVYLLILVPLVGWRFTTERLALAITLAGLTLAPFAIAYQAWKFLKEQERRHSEPTEEMSFVFRLLASTPVSLGGLLLILLVRLRG